VQDSVAATGKQRKKKYDEGHVCSAILFLRLRFNQELCLAVIDGQNFSGMHMVAEL
jgi:hypothetical protein